MDSTDGTCIKEIFFPGGRRRQVEIKDLALSSEDEVCCTVYYSVLTSPGTAIKVVNMGTAISETKLMDKWAASKRTQVSAILCIKLLPLLENALKLNFKALYETENLDPLQGPTHTLTPSSIHTQNRPQNYGWIYHLLSSLAGYSPKLTATLKNRGLATLGFQKKFHAHQLKPTQAKASFQKVNQNRDAFPHSPLGYRVLATHLLPLTSPVQLPNQPNSP